MILSREAVRQPVCDRVRTDPIGAGKSNERVQFREEHTGTTRAHSPPIVGCIEPIVNRSSNPGLDVSETAAKMYVYARTLLSAVAAFTRVVGITGDDRRREHGSEFAFASLNDFLVLNRRTLR